MAKTTGIKTHMSSLLPNMLQTLLSGDFGRDFLGLGSMAAGLVSGNGSMACGTLAGGEEGGRQWKGGGIICRHLCNNITIPSLTPSPSLSPSPHPFFS